MIRLDHLIAIPSQGKLVGCDSEQPDSFLQFSALVKHLKFVPMIDLRKPMKFHEPKPEFVKDICE